MTYQELIDVLGEIDKDATIMLRFRKKDFNILFVEQRVVHDEDAQPWEATITLYSTDSDK